MKRIFKILGVLILLLVLAALILPIVFKDEIVARAKAEMNKTLTATVDFQDIDISLFRSFPDVSLSIKETTVDGKDHFEGVRLADIGGFRVDLNLFSVISGSNYEVEGIKLSDATFQIMVDTAGNANYDIVKSDSAATEEDTAGDPASFKFTLKKYELDHVNLVYDDREGDIKTVIKNLNHTGTGDFTEEIVDLKTKTTIDELSVDYEGIGYLTRVRTKADLDLEFNQATYKITFGKNAVNLNDLLLKFTGYIAIPDENYDMDLSFEAPDNNFKSLLSLIPAVYLEGFESVKTSGDFAFNGKVKGVYNGEKEEYPTYDVKFKVNKASFRYPDLPAGVDGIDVDARVYNNSSNLDGTVVEIPKANATIAGSPVMASLNLKTPMSDPQFNIFVKTDFDLSNIAKVVPAEGYDYSGRLQANLDLAGKMSDIDNERYENVKAEGAIIAQNVVLKSDSLPYDVQVNSLDMAFSPQSVALNDFRSKIGRSDISASGKINNILAYALQDKTLSADFTLNSTLLDLNELSGSGEEAVEEEAAGTSSSALEVIRLPENIDFRLAANLQKVIYDNLEISNVSGNILLNNGKASMENIKMNLLGGDLAMTGAYDSKPALPEVDLSLDINNFTFKESFEKFVTVQKLAPIMENTTGSYSTEMKFSSKLNADMSPDLTSIEAEGNLVTTNLTTTTKSLQKLADLLKNQSLSKLETGRLDINFKIRDGRVEVQPFDLRAGNVTAVVSGSNGLDQSLDYTMDMKLPVSGIGATDLLNKVGVTQGGKMDLAVKIGGTFQNPKVSTSLGDLAGNVFDNLKNQAKEKVGEVKEEAKEKVNAKAQELIDAAEKKGDELIAEAQKQADNIRAEAKKAADKVRSEAEANAKKLEEEAKGNILKEKGAKIAADKLRSEAAQKASQIEAEANKKAGDLVNKAREEKEKLVEEARQKAQLQ